MRARDIKKEARERFAVNRYHAMLVYGVLYTIVLNLALITWALTVAFGMWWYGLILFIVFFLLLAPLSFGMTDFYAKSYRYEKVDAFHIFDGFNKYNLERVVILHLIRSGLTLCFTLLLIVPGIVYAIRTTMAVYLLRANPKMKASYALKVSNKLMKGHSGAYFVLALSFIGWFLLGLVTFGLAFVWLQPYYNTSKIVFYKRILQGDKTAYPQDNASEGNITEDEKNIALRLMKLQLSSEIEDVERQMKLMSERKDKPTEKQEPPPQLTDIQAPPPQQQEPPTEEPVITAEETVLASEETVIVQEETELTAVLPQNEETVASEPNKQPENETIQAEPSKADDKPTQAETVRERLERLRNERAQRVRADSSRSVRPPAERPNADAALPKDPAPNDKKA